MKLISKTFNYFLPIIITISAIAIVLVPFMAKVHQEGSSRNLAKERSELNLRLNNWKSKKASLDISIATLLKHDRLERYAIDTFMLQPPEAVRVISIPRKKNGEIIVESEKKDNEFLRFFKSLM